MFLVEELFGGYVSRYSLLFSPVSLLFSSICLVLALLLLSVCLFVCFELRIELYSDPIRFDSIVPLPLRKVNDGLSYTVNPRFDSKGRWRPRREWPRELRDR